jgi:hypothetical protein
MQIQPLVDEFESFSETSRQGQQETIYLMETLLAQVKSADTASSGETLRSLQEKAKTLYSALIKTYYEFNSQLRSKLTDKTKAFSGSSNLNEIWDPDTIKDLDAVIASYLIRGITSFYIFDRGQN